MWMILALLSAVFAALTSILAKVGMIACCSDGTRPVIFKIERIDYE